MVPDFGASDLVAGRWVDRTTMDVQNRPRERVFSILNDNDCPSFVIRQRPSSTSYRSPVPHHAKLERPTLPRAQQFTRKSSVSSIDSPPLLRFDSTSSKSSNSSSMDSPSPATPAFSYNDATLLPYDALLRQDLTSFIPSPSTITPFMEQQLMINAGLPEVYPTKAMHALGVAQYPLAPAPPPSDIIQLPTPASSLNSASTSISTSNNSSKTSPPGNGAPAPKKNKYPCPFAQSHNCQATFTTSGHAARHGKKHTGEKGVHCPVCNKAFTRKDNMKQHERTHKGSVSGASDDSTARRSKAAITKDAVKAKQQKKIEKSTSAEQPLPNPALITSPLSEVTTLPSRSTTTPINMEDNTFYPDASNPMLLPAVPIPDTLVSTSLYPPLGDDTLMGDPNLMHAQLDKLPELNGALPMPPLIRGFSDLDTLAQAAESFDPYYNGAI